MDGCMVIEFPLERRLARRRDQGQSPFDRWATHRMRCSICHEGPEECRIGKRLKQRWLRASREEAVARARMNLTPVL